MQRQCSFSQAEYAGKKKQTRRDRFLAEMEQVVPWARLVNATMELAYGQRIVFFNWTGFDEGDEICGSGSAELEDDGTIEIELSFHNGDDAILKARRE